MIHTVNSTHGTRSDDNYIDKYIIIQKELILNINTTLYDSHSTHGTIGHIV